ncbi:MAG: glycosyltransferase, partial [Bacteroidetes bacterium]|nr:glycosyltransferase [Bacteroidota bacterium]
QPIKEAIEKKISGKKIHILPNFADIDFYKPEIRNPALEEKYSVTGKFIVSYIGAIGVANGLDYLIECANASRKAKLPIHFILCGEGAMLNHLKSSAQKLKLKNISFTGFIDRNTVKEIMNITDSVFVCYKNVPILETGSPNKYFDALASGKLIITNFGGWIKDEIAKMQCGISVDPRHPTDFVKKIEPFLSDRKKLVLHQQASRKLAEEKYHRQKLSSQFADIFKKR